MKKRVRHISCVCLCGGFARKHLPCFESLSHDRTQETVVHDGQHLVHLFPKLLIAPLVLEAFDRKKPFYIEFRINRGQSSNGAIQTALGSPKCRAAAARYAAARRVLRGNAVAA